LLLVLLVLLLLLLKPLLPVALLAAHCVMDQLDWLQSIIF